MDGGADYFRGTCHYAKLLKKSELPESNRYFLEINGANSSADVYVNGAKKAHHDGGYSTWRVDITEDLSEDALLVIEVDNAPNSEVYPQVADFTFYGGIYRDVNVICVNESHFDLEYYGGKGLIVTPEINGADARGEGGENGQNHKGLVTIDRKYKKDSFYAYKAWLSDEPFVHICGKRYVDRVEAVTKVTVYSNQPSVELFANGKSLGVKEAADHFFYFDVPNEGETKLLAVAGECKDESFIQKVEKFNEAYRLVEQGAVLNWFDITEKEGYCSLNTKIGDIMGTLRGKSLLP